MKRQNKLYIFGSIIVVLILIFLFFLDIGINSKFYIKKDFSHAFQYRMAGDCISFSNYIYQPEGTWTENKNRWIQRCENEKSQKSYSIMKFKVTTITHQLGSDTAFLQAELTRNSENKNGYTYAASYTMKKNNLKWEIANELDNQ